MEVESVERPHVFLLTWVLYCQSLYLLPFPDPFPDLWAGPEQLLHGWVQSAGLVLCRPVVDSALLLGRKVAALAPFLFQKAEYMLLLQHFQPVPTRGARA